GQAGGRRERRLLARQRNEHEAERLPALADGVQVPVRRGRRRRVRNERLLQPDHGGGDTGGCKDVPEREELREGLVVPGEEVATSRGSRTTSSAHNSSSAR